MSAAPVLTTSQVPIDVPCSPPMQPSTKTSLVPPPDAEATWRDQARCAVAKVHLGVSNPVAIFDPAPARDDAH